MLVRASVGLLDCVSLCKVVRTDSLRLSVGPLLVSEQAGNSLLATCGLVYHSALCKWSWLCVLLCTGCQSVLAAEWIHHLPAQV